MILQKLQNDLKTKIKPHTSTSTARLSQKSLLGVGIKRKNGELKANVTSVDDSKQKKLEKEQLKAKDSSSKFVNNSESKTIQQLQQVKKLEELPCIQTDKFDKGHLKCVAILPGLGPYNESSDSEISSGSDDEPQGCEDNGKYDLVGRKHQKKKHDHQDE